MLRVCVREAEASTDVVEVVRENPVDDEGLMPIAVLENHRVDVDDVVPMREQELKPCIP